jgi:hypothetical protein
VELVEVHSLAEVVAVDGTQMGLGPALLYKVIMVVQQVHLLHMVEEEVVLVVLVEMLIVVLVDMVA